MTPTGTMLDMYVTDPPTDSQPQRRPETEDRSDTALVAEAIAAGSGEERRAVVSFLMRQTKLYNAHAVVAHLISDIAKDILAGKHRE